MRSAWAGMQLKYIDWITRTTIEQYNDDDNHSFHQGSNLVIPFEP